MRFVLAALLLLLAVVPQAAHGDVLSRSARQALNESAKLLEDGKHVAAGDVLREYVRAHPGKSVPLIHLQLGNALMAGGQSALAEAEYARCLEAAPAQPQALRNRGYALWELERFAEAAHSFEKAIVAAPEDAELAHLAAMAWYQAGEADRCVRIMEPLVASGTPRRGHVRLYANALAALERYEDARNFLRAAVERSPGDAALWEVLSIVCRMAGRHAEAASAMEIQFAIQEPGEARWRELSSLYAWLGFHAQAAMALERAAGPAPAPKDARNLVALWRAAGDDERTLGAVEYVLRSGPAPDMAAVKSRTLARLGRLDEAWDFLSARDRTQSAAYAAAWLDLGERLIRDGRTARAAQALDRAAGHARTKGRALALRAALEDE